MRALFLTCPPFRLRSPSSCDHDVWRLDGCGFRLLAGRDRVPFSSACWRSPFWCCSSVSTSTSFGFSARAVPLFWQVSPRPSGSDYGIGGAFFRRWWKPLSCGLGLSRCLIVHDGSPRAASPFLFPRPESQGGFLDCVLHSLSCPGALRFPPFLSSVEVGSSRGDLSLWSSGPPPLPAAGVVRIPSPPLLVVLPVIFHRGRVRQSPVLGSQSALS